MRHTSLLCLLLLPLTLLAENSFVEPPAPIRSPALAPCETCGGTGKRWTDNPGIRTNSSYRYADEEKRLSSAQSLRAQVTCNDCKGKGKLVRDLSAEERLQMQRAQRQKFDHACLQEGLIPVGAGYMTREAADALPPTDYATLAQTHPKTCSSCFGLKIESCRKCKGKGHIRERDTRSNRRDEMIEVPCPTCHSRGTQTCRKCDGEGYAKLCKKCQGTGTQMTRATKKKPATLERCRSCKGEGRR